MVNKNGLRSAGLSDREVLDVAQACAYFAYANRIVQGLGAEIEGGGTIGQWPSEGIGDQGSGIGHQGERVRGRRA